MSKNNREAAIKETLKWEGGYSNNPSDPGGPTNWGITLTDARKYWKKNASAQDVKSMPMDIAVDIYRSKYWKTPYYDCDKLEAGVDLVVFDFGVNSGPVRAKQHLDKALGGSSKETINKLCDSRLAFLQHLSTWSVFGKGWARRVAGIRSKALVMAGERPIIKPEQVATGGIAAIIVSVYAFVDTHKWEIIGSVALIALIVYLMSKWFNKRKKK